MIDSAGKNLVFMLCVPRSGSSLATTMLQNHSKVYASQEMWFLMSLYDLRTATPRPYGGGIILDRFFNAMLTDEMFEGACRTFAMQIYNELLQTCGSQIVVDKSPRYYYLLEFLDKLFPSSRRIWLHRNPLDIIASYKKVNRYQNTRFHIVEDLQDAKFNINMTDITTGLFRYYHYFARSHPNAYRLSYERLVSKPQEELGKLCGFLEIDYEEGLEKYGEQTQTSKGTMYTSMGVGDPFLFRHSEPHTDSLESWKEVLDKKEAEMYCRAIGSRIFQELGYGEQLSEAEKWTGVRFDLEPDTHLIELRTKQLKDLTGCRWQDRYAMSSNHHGGSFNSNEIINPVIHPEVVQQQITIRALEKRLEKSYRDQSRLRNQLSQMQQAIDRVKSMIPFGNRLSQWASKFRVNGGRGE